MTIDDIIKNHIPLYLTEPKKYELLKNLRESYPNVDYYCAYDEQELLQGDGWTKFDVFDIIANGKKEVSGLILSNTCDIDPNNERLSSTKITFATIVTLPYYKDLLVSSGHKEEIINNYLYAIKHQSVTNRFYLPKSSLMHSDYIVLLDDVHSIPFEYYLKKQNKKLHIRLSNAGFYIFILKLSIHFCRLFEGIDRNTPSLTLTLA